MDKVLQEERKKLAEIESKIDTIASRYEKKVRDLRTEIDGYFCVDYDDRMKKRELIQARSYATKLAEEFRGYQDSPYFGRIDLDTEENKYSSYYIGKDGISDSGEVIVVDWRSKIGSCYYASNQKEFNINGTNYLLALRRALDIKKGVLLSYRTEYDGDTVSLEGDVIDPFLLTVLKDKRRQSRLTDIIRTIQGNQNEIIRKPRADSFVVQGCAGSGKTMILLHRLSFLKFNNPNMSLSGIKIITPNKFFDAHINDLSLELGLTTIDRFSVEEYYVSLIKRYSSKNTADSDIKSEKNLNTDLLADVYSLKYLDDSVSHYHDYWNHILVEINEIRLRELFNKFKISYPDTNTHTVDIASQLEQGLKKITNSIEEVDKKKQSISSRLSAINEEVSMLQSELDHASVSFENTKKQTIHRIEIEISTLLDIQKKHEENIENLHAKREELQREIQKNDAELEQCVSTFQAFMRGIDVYSNYDQFIQRNDIVSNIIWAECNDIISTINNVESTYNKTPRYNFGKRNNLRKQLAELKEQFTQIVNHLISVKTRELQAQQNSLHEFSKSHNDSIGEIIETTHSIEKDIQSQKSRFAALNECLLLLNSTENSDLKTALSSIAYKECSAFFADYEEQRNIKNRLLRRLNSLIQNRKNLEYEQQELRIDEFTPGQKNYILNCNKILKKLQFSEISRNVMFRDLLAKYRAYEQKYQKTNYRHKLYLKLLYCSLYYTRLLSPDNFLNIDEAQDISIAEYHLLRMVLGDKCVFNLYGDINQSVYSYKGVTDWEEITNITGENIYVLNENYRNTLQITEFCNKEFGAEVYPIGISGEPVVELGIEAAIEWIVNIKKMNPEYRVAVLHRHGLKSVQDLLHKLLADYDVSWYSVDEKKLSVVSVEIAKGLEFEAVVAIVDQMSHNEKYISYTRALDKLAVVRDEFSAELTSDDGDEGIDDEFLESSDTAPEEPEKFETMDMSAIDVEANHLSQNRNILAQGNSNKDLSFEENEPLSEMVQDNAADHIHIEEAVSPQLSQEESLLIEEFNSILEEQFGSDYNLTCTYQQVISALFRRNKAALDESSGFMKSILLYLLALKEHQKSGKQTIFTAEAHLQENELAISDRLNLKGTAINDSMNDFLNDFKKNQYDIVFVSYDFFKRPENIVPFVNYFSDKVAYWGLDHPTSEKSIWTNLNDCCNVIGATMYLMSKDGFDGLDLTDFECCKISSSIDVDIIKEQTFLSSEERLKWILDKMGELQGQGIIYCEDENTCKLLSKQLRRNKIMAEAYVDVMNPNKRDRINYLTNCFSTGRLPVLIMTHEVGKNLCNPHIRFIVHFDIPSDTRLRALHLSQIGRLAENPVVYDLYVHQ